MSAKVPSADRPAREKSSPPALQESTPLKEGKSQLERIYELGEMRK